MENTGERDLHDVKITNKVPGQLTVTAVHNGGTRSGSTITWEGIVLNDGDKTEVSFTATVKDNTVNGHLLIDEATACSADHDLCDSDSDNTTVERAPQVAATTAPTTPVPVPVTAPTGSGFLSLLSTLLGTGSLALITRRHW